MVFEKTFHGCWHLSLVCSANSNRQNSAGKIRRRPAKISTFSSRSCARPAGRPAGAPKPFDGPRTSGRARQAFQSNQLAGRAREKRNEAGAWERAASPVHRLPPKPEQEASPHGSQPSPVAAMERRLARSRNGTDGTSPFGNQRASDRSLIIITTATTAGANGRAVQETIGQNSGAADGN